MKNALGAQNAKEAAVPASEVKPNAIASRTAIVALREARGAYRKQGSTLSCAMATALVFIVFKLQATAERLVPEALQGQRAEREVNAERPDVNAVNQ